MVFRNYMIYKFHPIFNSYCSNAYGHVIDIDGDTCIERRESGGYFNYLHLSHGMCGKKYLKHEFVWECFNGIIPPNGVIKHAEGNIKNNCLSNLRLFLQK